MSGSEIRNTEGMSGREIRDKEGCQAVKSCCLHSTIHIRFRTKRPERKGKVRIGKVREGKVPAKN